MYATNISNDLNTFPMDEVHVEQNDTKQEQDEHHAMDIFEADGKVQNVNVQIHEENVDDEDQDDDHTKIY